MKQFILTILLLSSPVFAFEDYMIISNHPVKFVRAQDKEILDVFVLSTIDNQKKNIIITPKKVGKTKIVVNFANNEDSEKIDVKVTENRTFMNVPSDFKLFLLDVPPKAVEIPQPPMFKGVK